MTLDDVYSQFESGFQNRKFSAGLLIALIDFFCDLGVPDLALATFDEFLEVYPRQTLTSSGRTANTLIVADAANNRTTSLRPFYNTIEMEFRATHKRYDYPSCAPHATQAWADYIRWFDALVSASKDDLLALRRRVFQFVLDTLQDQTFDPSSVHVDPPLFHLLLDGFEMRAQRNERTGATYQGMVFGFLRADNPHLQIEISKVRTGSRRLQRVGDIDAWEGARLAITAEVKQYEIGEDDVPGFEGFAHEVLRRGAVGIVAALGFQGESREKLELLGLKTRDVCDLLKVVEIWDPLKQRTAITSFEYYVKHVEKSADLGARLDEFLRTIGEANSLPIPQEGNAAAPAESEEAFS